MLCHSIILWQSRFKFQLVMGSRLSLSSFFIVVSCIHVCLSDKSDRRNGKTGFSVFEVVRFQNDPCNGSGKNGTCFTSQECVGAGGSEEGSCAGGFGVCCTFTLSCAGTRTSNKNITFIEQTPTTSALDPADCQYSVCSSSSAVCRIRFDFVDFVVASQTLGMTGTPDPVQGDDTRVGQCVVDTFQLLSLNGNSPSPVVCGTITGHHMYMDVEGANDCIILRPTIGANMDSTTSRKWTIQATQYLCSEQDVSGPKGCLQYFTAPMGIIRSFGMPESGDVGQTTTHLQGQQYTICIRRATNRCSICYWPTVTPTTVSNAMQGSFGVSVSPTAGFAQASTGTNCITDYIEIPGAFPSGALTTDDFKVTQQNSRFCGRGLGTQAQAEATGTNNAANTQCTRSLPFTVGVNFDDTEQFFSGNILGTDATTNEANTATGGIVGFRLSYNQPECV